MVSYLILFYVRLQGAIFHITEPNQTLITVALHCSIGNNCAVVDKMTRYFFRPREGGGGPALWGVKVEVR